MITAWIITLIFLLATQSTTRHGVAIIYSKFNCRFMSHSTAISIVIATALLVANATPILTYTNHDLI